MPRTKKSDTKGPVKTESLVPVIAELERAVIWAYGLTGDRPTNAKKVVVVVQTRGQKKNCLGFFRRDGWETKEGELVHEISISAEFLNRDVLEVIETVIHESAHLWNNDMEIKDCAEGGRHNQKFKDAAEMFGLVVSKGKQGWNQTELGDELKEQIEKEFKPDYEAFKLARGIKVKPKKDPTMIKWTCSEGCPIVRVSQKAILVANCETCEMPFVRDPEAVPLPVTL